MTVLKSCRFPYLARENLRLTTSDENEGHQAAGSSAADVAARFIEEALGEPVVTFVRTPWPARVCRTLSIAGSTATRRMSCCSRSIPSGSTISPCRCNWNKQMGERQGAAIVTLWCELQADS